MKISPTVFVCALAASFMLSAAAQDISVEGITSAIVADSGKPAKNFRVYAHSLNLTLLQLSPDQLARVFGNGALGGSSGAGEASGGSEAPGGSGTPPDNPAVDQPLIDMIHSGMSPGKLKNALIDASPLSEAVLSSFVDAADGLPPGIVLNVLLENTALPADVYLEVLVGGTSLNAGQIATLSVAQNGGGG